jgi:hypothetical protein
LAAQPDALTMAVSFTESVKPHLTVLQFDYNDAAKFLLAGGEILFLSSTCAKGLESVLIAGCRGTSG